MTADFSIAGRPIGAGHPVYVIAELSANHRQHEEVAVQLVHAAHEAGADAVKLQTYTPDTITIDSDAESFRAGSGSLWEGTTLYDLYQEAYMPWEWQPRLKTLAESLGMDCFSSPFDPTAVDFLAALDVPAFKVASFELVDLPLIRRMAATGKPLVISTGMGTEAEIDEAVAAARAARGHRDRPAQVHAAPIRPRPRRSTCGRSPRWRRAGACRSDCPTTRSGRRCAIGAVALGACIVEKHMTPSARRHLARRDVLARPGRFPPDGRRHPGHRAGARGGRSSARPKPRQESRRFRRSLFVVEDIAAGETLTEPTSARSGRPTGCTPATMTRCSGGGRRGRSSAARRCPGT